MMLDPELFAYATRPGSYYSFPIPEPGDAATFFGVPDDSPRDGSDVRAPRDEQGMGRRDGSELE